MSLVKLGRALFPIALFVLPAACGHPSDQPDAGPAIVPLALDPIPAPPGLLAKVFIGAPEATWAKARTAIGAPAALLPQGFGALTLTLLELPITLAGEIDGAVPTVGALVLPEGKDSAAFALAIHVKAGDRLADMLTKGDLARFTVKPDTTTHIAMLEPKTAERGARSMGILGNYLVVAKTADDLKAAAPYAARTLGTESPPKDDIAMVFPEAAISGPIAARARDMIAKLEQAGTFRMSQLVLSNKWMPKLVDLLPDLEGARLTLNFEGPTLRVHGSAIAKPSGPAAAMVAELAGGDAKPLLALPVSAVGGALLRLTPAQRMDAAVEEADSIVHLLGNDVPQKDADAIKSAVSAIADARGDWTVLGATFAATGPTGLARSALGDRDKMSKALEQLLGLTKLPSVQAKLKETEISISSGKTTIENLPGDVRRVLFEQKTAEEREKEKKKLDPKGKTGAKGPDSAPPDAIELDYLLGKETIVAAAGYDAKNGLKSLVDTPVEKTVASNAQVKAALDAVGSDAFFVVYGDPGRVSAALAGQPPPAEASLVVLSIGRAATPPSMYVRIDLAASAIQDLIRRRGL